MALPLDFSHAVKIKDLSFSYPQQNAILSDISWEVAQGSFVLLTGNNGVGKTTLLRLLKPELAPVGTLNGIVQIFGHAIHDIQGVQSARLIGYVAQNPDNQIVCDSVWHELAFGLENLGIKKELMHRRVAEVVHFFGIESWMRKKTSELSGGQKQLLLLASTLAMRPRLLLLDEPTSQLDPVAAKNFIHALFRVNKELGLTIIVATHNLESMIDYASDCVELKEKQILKHSVEHYRNKMQQLKDSVDFSQAAPVCADYMARTDVVSLKDIFVRYTRDTDFVLRNCNLKVKQATIHAIIGANASGKTTLLRSIAGDLKIERGKIRNLLSKNQAFIPQNPKALFICDTVDEELHEWQKYCTYSQRDIDSFLNCFSLTDSLKTHPYDLSVGQQQSLAFIKVMLTKPQLVLIDEPTKGLDMVRKFLLADEMVRMYQKGVSVVFVSHDLSFVARVAHSVSLLFDGQIVCTQACGEFFDQNLFYRPCIDAFFDSWSAKLAKTNGSEEAR